MKKRTVLIILAVVLIAGALGWKLYTPHDFLYAGTVEATEVDLSSRITSIIASYDVKESEAIHKGQRLVRMTCEDQNVARDWAARNFRRAQHLLHAGSATQESYDQAVFQRDNAALQAEWCAVLSPLDGLVLQNYQEAGERVNPGTKLLTVADLREVYAYVYVPQPLVARLRLGMSVTGILPELSHPPFEGEIRHIRQDAEFTPKNVQTRDERTRLVYGVKIYFKNADLTLKPGMTIEVKLPS